MDERQWLVERFEAHRAHLRAVAYRMLGSLPEAEDAVQQAWLHLSRADLTGIENLGGWLTTVVGRLCLDLLRARWARREDALDDAHVPDPVVAPEDDPNPEQAALYADSIGLALLVVLDTLGPAERVAFVLHDMFDVPFEEVAPIVGRSLAATRQLASRARRRVTGASAASERDTARQRVVVDAFLAATRDGNLEALLAVLDPDIVLRADAGTGGPAPSRLVRGARAVAGQAILFSKRGPANAQVHRVMVNGTPGIAAFVGGKPFSILAFEVSEGRIVELDILSDPRRLEALDLSFLAG